MVLVAEGRVETSHTWSSATNYPKPVTVASFRIGAYAVTYDLWYEIRQWAIDTARGENKYRFANAGREGQNGTAGVAPTDRRYEPVTTISWRDAVVWCNAYSEKTGKTPAYKYNEAILRESDGKAENAVIDTTATGYRLPTEAEWEFAARGGVPATTTPWAYTYAGSNTAGDVAWYNENSGNKTHEVGEKAPNSLGLYDMSGNVLEWCLDMYSSASSSRILLGGAWNYFVSSVVVDGFFEAIPYSTIDNDNGGYGGFRLVCPSGSE
jgi:formylglycine-generating enzyme required for sulfatase activity